MPPNINLTTASIAINRFGLGMRPDETIPQDARNWLRIQFKQYQALPSAWANQRKGQDIVADLAINKMQINQADDAQKSLAKRFIKQEIRDDYIAAVNFRAASALETNTPFIERLVHFWSNHFAISAQKPGVIELAGAFELEAIRPYVLGNFKDMLLAVETHPAMLIYLDQVKSTGPNSALGLKSAKHHPDKLRGLNENLAREILELHTLGVRSGYSQTDVTEFARALTGWSIAGDNANKQPIIEGANGYAYRPQLHEPGHRTILGKQYSQAENAQAQAILQDLATNPATAKHIATKLARHFVSDNPPDNLINQLAQAFINGNGELSHVYQTLIDAPEAWQMPSVKFKTPWEWLISALRGLKAQTNNRFNIAQLLNQLGQPTWKPGSPAGYDDIAASWAAPNALLRRVEFAQRLASTYTHQEDARNLIVKLLLGTASQETINSISRAESASTGLALLLVSPEFLRR